MVKRQHFLLLCFHFINCQNISRIGSLEQSELSVAVTEVLLTSFIGKYNNFHIVSSVESGSLQYARDLVTELIVKARSEMSVQIEEYAFVNVSVDERKRYPVVVIVDTFESFLRFNNVLTYERFKLRRPFLFVFIKASILKKLNEIFKVLWRKFVVNANVIAATGDIVQMFSFTPFTQAKCSDSSALLMNKFSNGKWDSRKFYPKKFSNLFGCPLTFGAALNFPAVMQHNGGVIYGLEVNLLNMFADKKNFSVDLELTADRGRIYANGSATGLMKTLLDGRVDGILGFYSFEYVGTVLLGETKSYFSDSIVLVISSGAPLSALQKLLYPFDGTAWALLLVVVIIVASISKALPRRFNEPHTGQPHMNIMIAITGQSQRILPKTDFARLYLMTFLMLFFIVRTMYAARLFESMKNPPHEKELVTISELVQQQYSFIVHDNMDQNMESFALSSRCGFTFTLSRIS